MHPKAKAYSATLGNFHAENILILSFFGYLGYNYGSPTVFLATVKRD